MEDRKAVKNTTTDENGHAQIQNPVNSEYENIIQECLKKLYTTFNEDDAIEKVLACLGKQLNCDRVIIFLGRKGRGFNTEFEWCADGIASLKEQIKNEPLGHLIWNHDFLKKEYTEILYDADELRNIHPAAYALMKSRQVESLAIRSMMMENDAIGIMSLENPDTAKMPMITAILDKLNSHIKSQLKRRTMFRQLEEMSFHDQLTGAFNRNALSELYQRPLPMKSIGVIFCDVSGLKQVNDTKGHEEGDEMIIQCYRLIQQNVRTEHIYRMGGDEFLALCFDCTKEDAEQDFEKLKGEVAKSQHHIAVGLIWSDKEPLMLESLIAAADHEMYLDKQEYYSTRDYFARMAKESTGKNHVMPDREENSAFQKYIKNYYFDAEALMKSLTINNMNQFFFFGDVKKNYFYVSDHMRDRFGFESNLMLNLPHHWEQRICDEEYKRINSQAVERLFCEKQNTYELLHLVQDVHGNRIWVHNSGTLQWNTDKTVPLFLSGRITLQDKDYSIDQISGFHKDYKALIQLENMQSAGQETAVIGFCLNHFAKVNKTERTYYGNMLMYHIGKHLLSKQSGRMTFYRLDGDCFVAILEPEFAQEQYRLMEEIRAIIEEEYKAIEVYDEHPASFALLHYKKEMGTPQEFLETVCERIDTAKNMPNLPYVTVSEESQKEIEHTEQMVAMLRKNIQNNMENFRIVVQPAIHTDTKLLAGGEALLRWEYEGRDVLPDEILPLLEQEGLLSQVDRWVMEQTISAGARLKDYAKDFILAFNVSAQALQSGDLTEFLDQMVARYGVEKRKFYVEMKEENMLMQEMETDCFKVFAEKSGIQIMQKRFGALGSLLKAGMEEGIDAIKLEAALLEELEPEKQMKYLESLVFLCHKFGKRLSLAKVEDQETYEKAVRCGCDYSQGYYHYRPLELTELYTLLLAEEDKIS